MIGSEKIELETNPHSIVSVENLVKSYGGREEMVRAIDGVSLTVEAGSIVGLLGSNGAGKTTLIKSILGLITPTSGSISVGGVDVVENPNRAHAKMAAVLEGARSTYWRLTIRENLEFFGRLNGEIGTEERKRYHQFLERLNLTEKIDDVVNDLSRGEKQRVSLATAMARDIDVLFLDEPTLGLDVEGSFELQQTLTELAAQRGVTILVSSHDLGMIESVCDRGIVLDAGEIVADDDIENLLDVLQTRAYELIVEGGVAASTRSEIEPAYDVVSWVEHGGCTKLTVTVSNANRIHGLTGALVRNGLQIRSIRMDDTDFEAVFASLVYDRPHVDEPRAARGER